MQIDWLTGEPWPFHTIAPQDSGSNFNQPFCKKKHTFFFKKPKPLNAIDDCIYPQQNKASVAQAFPPEAFILH